MLNIVNVTAPFFALVACGFLAARCRLLPDNAVPALNTYVLYFALPCMLFRFTAATPFEQIFNPQVLFAYTATGIAILVIFIAAFRFATGKAVHECAYAGLAVAWSNWGYMGFALIPSLLGPQSLPVIIAAGIGDLLLIVSAGLALAGSGGSGEGSRFVAVMRGAVLRVARNPLMWAVIAGTASAAISLSAPVAIDSFVRLLGVSAGPVALFAIGVSLYRPGVRVLRGDIMMITGAKLLLHPYLAGLAATYVFSLSRLETHTLVLIAALPVAGTVYLFAERAGAGAEPIAGAILVSTALAFFSFSALCWAFGVQFGA